MKKSDFVIYLAGPFTASTAWKIEQNVRAAEEIALDLWKRGWTVFCPHLNSRLFFGEVNEKQIVNGYLNILKRCDLLLLMPFWEDSKGTKTEADLADEIGIPVVEMGIQRSIDRVCYQIEQTLLEGE